MIAMKFTALVTLAALLWTFILSGRAGAMRGKYGVNAPATTGNIEFEKAFRIHANTIETLVLLIPLLWMATAVVGDLWAALAGLVWIVGRVIYAKEYMADPSTRTPGMVITVLPMGALAIIVIVGIIKAFL